MTTDIYLQNRLIQTSQTGGQQYSDTSPLVFPGITQLPLTTETSGGQNYPSP